MRPGARNKSVTIDGAGVGQTILTASESTMDYQSDVVWIYGAFEETLSNVTVSGDGVRPSL